MSERLRVEEQLQRSEQRFHLFSEAAFEGLLIHERGAILDLNTALARMFGYEPAEMIGRQVWEFLTPESQQEVKTRVEALVEASYELTGVRRNGETFPIEVRAKNMPWEGRNLRVVAVRDITERKRLERQLSEAQKMEAVGRLAGGVAHDFNNLLTVIVGYTQMLMEELPEGDPRHTAAHEILNAAQRAAALARQLLAFGRRQVLQPRVIRINALVEEMSKLLRRVIGEHIEMRLELGPDAGNVRADPTQLEQVLLNLALNARDAMPEGGSLTIRTARVELEARQVEGMDVALSGPFVLLAVEDTGHGMDEATRRRIFEPFFSTKPLAEGAGLGLAVVYGTVRQHGGAIEVESRPGRGTVFRVYLPSVEEPAQAAVEKPAEGKPRGSETLLLVEDEARVRRMTRRLLEDLGYTVLEAPDPATAQQICRTYEGTIHMLVTDVIMPQMSGRRLAEIAARLRPGIKVLYLSGYSDGEIGRAEVLEAGVNLLAKPFSVEALARKVREVLDSAGSRAPAL
ncbi:MAG: PAS domain S-box protein [Bryobacterales bacterium]|nr:PAS domain S-box protein [Bryobacterales bacterium]